MMPQVVFARRELKKASNAKRMNIEHRTSNIER